MSGYSDARSGMSKSSDTKERTYSRVGERNSPIKCFLAICLCRESKVMKTGKIGLKIFKYYFSDKLLSEEANMHSGSSYLKGPNYSGVL